MNDKKQYSNITFLHETNKDDIMCLKYDNQNNGFDAFIVKRIFFRITFISVSSFMNGTENVYLRC